MTLESMTRRTFVLGTVAASPLLVGCSGDGSSEGGDAPALDDDSKEVPSEGESLQEDVATEDGAKAGRVLVAYYSRAGENYAGGGTERLEVGHTKVMAGYIVEALGADEYEIVPTEAYPDGYQECCDVALQERADDVRPAIAGALPDVSSYDAVLIGCPIWWGDEPMIIRTFVESVSLSGKTVVPFTTHAGSGLGSVPQNLRGLVDDATFLDGLAVAGTSVDASRDDVVGWAKGLSL